MTDTVFSPSFANPKHARISSFSSVRSPKASIPEKSVRSPARTSEKKLPILNNQDYLEGLIDRYFSVDIVRELLTCDYAPPTAVSSSTVVDFHPRESSVTRDAVSPSVVRPRLSSQLAGRGYASSDDLPLAQPVAVRGAHSRAAPKRPN